MHATKYYFTESLISEIHYHAVLLTRPTLSPFKSRMQNHDISFWSIEFTL